MMTAVVGLLVALAVAVAAARLRSGSTRSPAESAAGSRPRRQLSRRQVAAIVAVLGVTAALVIGPSLTAVFGAAAAAVVMLRRRRSADAERRAVELAMPDAIELLVVSLHAGLTPTQSIAELARLAPAAVRPGFAAVEQRLHRGAGFVDALGELTQRCGRSAIALVSAMSAAVRDGLPLAPTLDRLTDEATASRRRNGEAAARRLPVRLSFPLVACTLPSFVLLAIAPAVLGAISTVRGSTP